MHDTLIKVGNDSQLFIDDFFTEHKANLVFRINQPVKTYEKCVVAEKPWEDVLVGPYCTVMDDDGRYRMWYESYSKINAAKPLGVLCYAESDDGVNWCKPELGILPFRGSCANNIVYPQPGTLYHGGTVFKDPSAPSDSRYKMIYAILSEGVFGAYSSDGLRWSKYEGHFLQRNQADTQNVCLWDDRLNKYVCYIRANILERNPNCTRTVGRSETTDFLNWPCFDVVLAADGNDPADVDFYNSAAVKYARSKNAYFIITSLYYHGQDVLEPQLAVSRDGINWQRPERKPFIPLGAEGTFDSAMIHTCVGHIIKDDQVWIYYRGISRKHNQPYGQTNYGGIITRAVLRVDGFVSLDAGADEGYILTKPMIFDGSKLELNYKTSANGYVKAEICDDTGRALEEFSSSRCMPLCGDSVSAVVNWQENPNLKRLAGTPVRLRLVAKDAKVYAFSFAKDRK